MTFYLFKDLIFWATVVVYTALLLWVGESQAIIACFIITLCFWILTIRWLYALVSRWRGWRC